MVRHTIQFFGNVQGVGFRYTACAVAKHFDITGYVRNCSNGSVELIIEGTSRETKLFLDSLREKMSGHIEKVKITESKATAEFFGFGIR